MSYPITWPVVCDGCKRHVPVYTSRYASDGSRCKKCMAIKMRELREDVE